MNERFYMLRIKMLGIKPEIWRRFVVPGSITLDRLHDVIQIVMGWQDYHLFEFAIGKKRFTENPEFEKEQGAESGKYRLVDQVKRNGRKFGYLYDFGDSWEHEITLEDSHFGAPGNGSLIECLNGARACPPEDVGGVPGYVEFCKSLKDPGHEDHESNKEWFAGFSWYDGVFESEKFDLEKVNNELMKYLRWSRERFHPWINF